MLEHSSILSATAPVFLTIAVGFAIRRAKILQSAADQSLLALIINILYPALILRYVMGSAVVKDIGNVALAPIIGFGTVTIGFILSLLVARKLRFQPGNAQRTFSFTTGIYNYGYMPIPIIMALFPLQSDDILAVLLVHNVGVEAAFWTAGIIIVSGQFDRNAWRKILNAPVITIVFALIANLSGIADKIPGTITACIEMLANCAIPLGLIITGATISDLLRSEKKWYHPIRVPLTACILRLLVFPILFLGIALMVPDSMPELKRIVVIQAAMPAGMIPIVIASHYGGHRITAMQVVIGTTLVSLVTIPLWIEFGIHLVL